MQSTKYTVVTVDFDKMTTNLELKAEIESQLFGENFKKYATIKKCANGVPSRSLYDLHFYNPPDALYFSLRYGYCVENR